VDFVSVAEENNMQRNGAEKENEPIHCHKVVVLPGSGGFRVRQMRHLLRAPLFLKCHGGPFS